MPQPHVYANFTRKQDLFLAALQRAIHEASSNTSEVTLAPTPDPEAAEMRLGALLLQAIAVSNEPSLRLGVQDQVRSVIESRGREYLLDLVRDAAAAQLHD